MHNFVMELERGYETRCGEKGVQMSGEALNSEDFPRMKQNAYPFN